tara:strand:- start:398 stop:853 length:456 start_codon:yes stop_codon:yes gene_type:complete
MHRKIIILVITILFIHSCGYSPMFSQNKNSKYNFELSSFEGDRDINNSIKYFFKRYNDDDGLKIFVKTNTEYSKGTKTKDLAGNIVSFSLSASVTFTVNYGDNTKTFKFGESSTINNMQNSLDETIVEKDIKRNFGVLFSERLILKFATIK